MTDSMMHTPAPETMTPGHELPTPPPSRAKGVLFLRDGCLPPSPCYYNAITNALDAGFDLDVYAPQLPQLADEWRGRVQGRIVQYTMRWLLKHALKPSWRKASFFMGTPRLGVAFAGVLGAIHRRPHVVLCDEIFSGSYAGDDPKHWVRLSNWCHRRAKFTILPDLCRRPILLDAVPLPTAHQIYESPNSPCTPPAESCASQIRQRLSIPDDAFVVMQAGHLHRLQGGHWMLKVLPSLPPDVYLMIHNGLGNDGLVAEMTDLLEQHYPIRCSWEHLSWIDVEGYHAAADCGLVFYLHDGPQFQAMGRSSTKLCMFLRHGVPVIASRQDSFRFLEEYACGVLIDQPDELLSAIDHIRNNQDTFRQNAFRCYREHVDPKFYQPRIVDAFRNFGNGA
jgi:glycosyltransferase involved in cell wall biosynthesis